LQVTHNSLEREKKADGSGTSSKYPARETCRNFRMLYLHEIVIQV
jgi:hypothetical protein